MGCRRRHWDKELEEDGEKRQPMNVSDCSAVEEERRRWRWSEDSGLHDRSMDSNWCGSNGRKDDSAESLMLQLTR